MAAIHFAYSDRSRFRARTAELTLIATSVVFLLTTFADDQIYKILGFDANVSRVLLGLASAAAFFFSVALAIVDWAGTAALHKDAGGKFSALSMRFRQTRRSDGTWPEDIADELSEEYELISVNTEAVPDKKFNALKAKYLTKREVSALASRYPGAPLFVLGLVVRAKASKSVWHARTNSKVARDEQ